MQNDIYRPHLSTVNNFYIGQHIKEALSRCCGKRTRSITADVCWHTLYGKFAVVGSAYKEVNTLTRVLDYLNNNVVPHKTHVYNAGIWLLEQIGPEFLTGQEHNDFMVNLDLHDLSKFSYIEALGYSGWDFKTKTGDEQGFIHAWHHHKANNPHHPEYWLDVSKSGQVVPLTMPKIYGLEMVADWLGASQTYGTPFDAWVYENAGRFLFNQPTKELLADILTKSGIDTSKIKYF